MELLLLLTASNSIDGAVFTISDTPGSEGAKRLHDRRMLVVVGPVHWPDSSEEVLEWTITRRGSDAFAAHPQGKAWTSPLRRRNDG